MYQHVCHRRAICTDKAEAQVGCRPKDEVPPSLTNVGESIPPAFPNPLPSPIDTYSVILAFTQEKWSIEMKDVEK
jgi:hypothetical protein